MISYESSDLGRASWIASAHGPLPFGPGNQAADFDRAVTAVMPESRSLPVSSKPVEPGPAGNLIQPTDPTEPAVASTWRPPLPEFAPLAGDPAGSAPLALQSAFPLKADLAFSVANPLTWGASAASPIFFASSRAFDVGIDLFALPNIAPALPAKELLALKNIAAGNVEPGALRGVAEAISVTTKLLSVPAAVGQWNDLTADVGRGRGDLPTGALR